ncbi:hypothetical protein AO268_27255 [Pseudomonas sp. ICMP 8385]|nr:hypothetical protein BLL38_06285 [Pseudomonas gessardii]PHN55094.1 hypothetical protein AO268_27255 [Pseudomonas sp. ICMP 8385]
MIYGFSIGRTKVHITTITLAIRGRWLPLLALGAKKLGTLASSFIQWVTVIPLDLVYFTV